jgi:hypothetical protein
MTRPNAYRKLYQRIGRELKKRLGRKAYKELCRMEREGKK